MNERELQQVAILVAERLRTARRGSGERGAEPDGCSATLVADVTTGEVRSDAAGPAPRSPLPTPRRVADFVDHTLLKAEATRAEIETLCAEAAEHRFAAVCVNGSWVKLCADLLDGCGVAVAAVAGFPLGAMTSRAKASETNELVELGADEIDMVAPVGRILDGDWDYVEDDVNTVVSAARGKTVKVILETAALQPLQIVKASAIAMEAGAHYVKTSTGFHPAGGATAEAVALMRLVVGDRLGVKASGGVRDCATALRMIVAGANRIGTSSGVGLVECVGAGPGLLEALLADPDGHDRVCRSGASPAVY